jgi:hypothetical protein
MAMRSPLRPYAVLLASAAVLVAACGTDDDDATTTIASTAARSEWTIAVMSDPRVDLQVAHPPRWEFEVFESRRDSSVTDSEGSVCAIPRYSLGTIEVELVPSSCDVEFREPGNGLHGAYRTITDVSDGDPVDLERIDTPVGMAEVFTQDYYECTNECIDYVDRVAIVTLDDPADPGYPTLVVRSNKDEVDPDEFAGLLTSLAEN